MSNTQTQFSVILSCMSSSEVEVLSQVDGICLHHQGSDFIAQSSRASRLLWLCQLSQPGPWSCISIVLLLPGSQEGCSARAHCHGTELLLGSVPAAHSVHTAAASSCATQTTKRTSDSLLLAAAATTGAAKAQQKQLNCETITQNLFSCFLTSAMFQ